MYSAADAEHIEYTYLKHYTVSQKTVISVSCHHGM